ncbi:MAG: DUF1289 domain-containing protein [Betaproteobacteria bacterium]
MTDASQSPCIKVCVMDAERRFCAGCFRTLDEIARWGGMGDAERAAVVALLPGRHAARGPNVHDRAHLPESPDPT